MDFDKPEIISEVKLKMKIEYCELPGITVFLRCDQRHAMLRDTLHAVLDSIMAGHDEFCSSWRCSSAAE